MEDYLSSLYQQARDYAATRLSRAYRFSKLESMKKAGKLETMCSSELHEEFGITKEF